MARLSRDEVMAKAIHVSGNALGSVLMQPQLRPECKVCGQAGTWLIATRVFETGVVEGPFYFLCDAHHAEQEAKCPV
jgi:hypothetical protein